MFIPGRDWLYRLHHQRRWFFAAGLHRPLAKPRPMTYPMFNADIFATNDTLAHWLFLYDRRYETAMPGVRTFESYSDLLDKLLFSDLEHVRESMREYNEKTFKPALRWYRSAVFRLVKSQLY